MATGVPGPFVIEGVFPASELERHKLAVHKALADARVESQERIQERLSAVHRGRAGGHAGNAGDPRAFRALNEGFVESDKPGAGRSATQVHRIGEFHSALRERERGNQRRFILRMYVLETQQLRECAPNRTLLKPVQAPEHPARFEEYRFCDPDWPGRKQGARGGRLLGFVAGQQPD